MSTAARRPGQAPGHSDPYVSLYVSSKYLSSSNGIPWNEMIEQSMSDTEFRRGGKILKVVCAFLGLVFIPNSREHFLIQTRDKENRMRKSALLAIGFASLLSGDALVWAHATGHESRTVADCEKLPGTAVAGPRA